MIFAIYRGEKFLDERTIEELAERFNVKPETILFWSYPANIKRDRGNRKIAVRLD